MRDPSEDHRFSFTGRLLVINQTNASSYRLTPAIDYVLAKGKKFSAGGLPDYNTADKESVFSWVSEP
jgi:hypothetical protein